MKNKIIIIGFRGVQTAYLNVDLEECKRRYAEANDYDIELLNGIDSIVPINIIEFDDEFTCYKIC